VENVNHKTNPRIFSQQATAKRIEKRLLENAIIDIFKFNVWLKTVSSGNLALKSQMLSTEKDYGLNCC